MKSIIFLLIIVSSISLFSFSQNISKSHNNKIVAIKKGDLIINKYKYDSIGNLITEETKYFYIKYKYNSKNQLISICKYVDEGNLSSNYNVVEAYHKRVEWVNPQNTETHYNTTFEYNENGQMIKSTNDYGSLLYEYDNANKIIKETYYYIDGKKYSYYIDKYDDNGNLICKQEYSVDDLLINEQKFIFDDKFNPFNSLSNSLIPGIDTNKNNIVKTVGKYNFENIYFYNDYGYPVKKDNVEFIYE